MVSQFLLEFLLTACHPVCCSPLSGIPGLDVPCMTPSS